jgi:23S rRNA (cytidine2498-2'-O)-methyltransferase
MAAQQEPERPPAYRSTGEGDAGEYVLTIAPDFVEMGLAEARKVDPALQLRRECAPGVYLASGTRSFLEIAAVWRAAPPIFVRHISPVHVAAELAGTAADLETISQYVLGELSGFFLADAPFSVQTRLFGDIAFKPYDLNQRLADAIGDVIGAPLDVRAPQQVVSAVCVAAQQGEGPDRQGLGATAYLGWSRVEDNLSSWAGGMRRFAREEGQISRAEFKLLEAFEVFGIELPPRGVALDLGAAPGGWTRVLRQRQQYVTAVDPGELDPRIAEDRGVRHKRMTAEAYLSGEPDTFDLIVNDMRMDARDSARLMVSFARQLYPHGIGLMTLKLPETNPQPALDHALNILRQTYVIAGAKQLFHNRSEVTVYLKKNNHEGHEDHEGEGRKGEERKRTK